MPATIPHDIKKSKSTAENPENGSALALYISEAT